MMKPRSVLSLFVIGTILLSLAWRPVSASNQTLPMNQQINFDSLAVRIIASLKLGKGERVLIRFDPDYFAELIPPLRSRIRAAGAVEVGAIEYASIKRDREVTKDELTTRAREFERLLGSTDVYLWLPLRPGVRVLPAPEALALVRWLDKGGARREIHFHWSAGSILPDALPGEHSPDLDRIYQSALDIDYARLSDAQDRAIAALRSGIVRVYTPSGTDLSFKVGNRPFNKQNGDASAERMKTSRVRIDREIELPAGVLRVAPLEETANGRIVIPFARFGDKTARNIRFQVESGSVIRVDADENLAAVEAALSAGGDAARRFREFGLGFNPKLKSPPGSVTLAYYGYAAGVVRLSLGDNEELGGSVRGNFVRWFFFPDATVEVNGRVLVRDGKLLNSSL